ncbi:hypothetical protein ACIA6C_28105 [Streptomyces sp. NPDC051578]|uniref:hypothetical protein n=1 Tax=Streptomyces sp. NPDC051578 TaxID=3365662 RepID=UPI0037BB7D31
MSVNYYAFGPFPGGEAGGEGLHIGQYAQGWRFLMRSHPDRGLTSLEAWLEFLRQSHVVIRAEHGVQYTPAEMEETIRERTDSCGWPRKARIRQGYERAGYHVDAEGYDFCALEFC